VLNSRPSRNRAWSQRKKILSEAGDKSRYAAEAGPGKVPREQMASGRAPAIERRLKKKYEEDGRFVFEDGAYDKGMRGACVSER